VDPHIPSFNALPRWAGRRRERHCPNFRRSEGVTMWHRCVLNKDLLVGLLVRACFRLRPFADDATAHDLVAGFWEAIVREVVWLNARSHQVSFVISIVLTASVINALVTRSQAKVSVKINSPKSRKPNRNHLAGCGNSGFCRWRRPRLMN
jgi:hypothetical protein